MSFPTKYRAKRKKNIPIRRQIVVGPSLSSETIERASPDDPQHLSIDEHGGEVSQDPPGPSQEGILDLESELQKSFEKFQFSDSQNEDRSDRTKSRAHLARFDTWKNLKLFLQKNTST